MKRKAIKGLDVLIKKKARLHEQARLEGVAAAKRLIANIRPPNPRNLPATLTGRRQEIKSVDWPVAASSPQNVTLNSTMAIYLLNAVTEGSSFYNRIGRKIMMKSLHLTAQIIQTGNTTAGVSEYTRLMVIYDRQPNGANPVIADILTNYDPAGATATNSLCSLNMNNSERFIMLRDIRFTSPTNALTAVDNSPLACMDYTVNRVNINEFIRLKDLETHYKSSSNPAVIGDIATGALYLVGFGNRASGSECYGTFCTTRLRFHDT